ncbi:MAG: methyltransferase [Bdellovibrionaceae bacterium]|nr:methyltransferase [Bdellovibrionales bacterium]MCB9084738.1 methyltransferase [Pseudobdellovibrionaceae bacterium]
MSLFVIATPIGHYQDLGHRALEILHQCSVIITEERKEGSRLLRHFGISGRQLEELNEHTNNEGLAELVALCTSQDVALISDAGTPGFCDPGADLVSLCRKKGVQIQSVPGPSSLMALLSISGRRLDEFYFRGFISPKTEERIEQLRQLKSTKVPVVLMDTPYRLKKMLTELDGELGEHTVLLGLNLSQENEVFLEGRPGRVLKDLPCDKAEFVLILLPS